MSGNQAVDINPPNAAISINTNGSDWLWAAFSLFLASDLGVIAWMWLRPSAQRILHLLPIIILSISSVVYFTMAADLGSTPITAEFYGDHHQTYAGEPATRAIWYVRYIGWVLTMPLLTLEVLLTTGLPATEVSATLFMQVVAFVSLLVGALVSSTYKWGYFVFGTAAILYVVVHLLAPARVGAGAIGTDVRSIFTRSAAAFTFLLLLYPLAWGLSDGGNVITSDGEMAFYGVLDVLIQPVFLLAFLFQLRSIDVTRFGFAPRHVLVIEKPAVSA
ncbi:family A G protein-coupled receptor-like protein [Calocera cornea HHB12733]|uniref:Family A G protein-coupled receptor-like protein n=1 Tax=Calocera cornea HHB12733 TaxID=1353952 RepID=A0A165CJB2_9BASI|nr:family A G protein-coupled receptor-like protein [Calocera cornea HHB12733]